MPITKPTNQEYNLYVYLVWWLNANRGKTAANDARYLDFLHKHRVTHEQVERAVFLCANQFKGTDIPYVYHRGGREAKVKGGEFYLTRYEGELIFNHDTQFLPQLLPVEPTKEELQAQRAVEILQEKAELEARKRQDDNELQMTKEEVVRLLTTEAHIVGRMLGTGYNLLEPIHGEWIRNWILNPEDFRVTIHQAHRDSYKCFAPDTKVLMYDGTTKAIKDIKVGEVVMGWDKTPRKVVNSHSGYDKKMYKVHLFDDNFRRYEYICNSLHILSLVDKNIEQITSESFVDMGINKYLRGDRFNIYNEKYRQVLYRDGRYHLLTQNFEVVDGGEFVGIEVEGDKKFLLANGVVVHNTTCLRLCVAILIILNPLLTIIVLRKSEDAVKELVNGVSKILDTPLFQTFAAILHPDLYLKGGLKKTTDTALAIDTNLNTSLSGEFQLRALGLGSPLTGKHAGLIITDDIVTTDDRESEAERRNTIAKYQELMNILSNNKGFSDTRILNIGTPWHEEDAFALMERGLKDKSEFQLDLESRNLADYGEKRQEKIKNTIRQQNMKRGMFVYNCYQTGLMSLEDIAWKRKVLNDEPLFQANYLLNLVSDAERPFPKIKNIGKYSKTFFKDAWEVSATIDGAYGGDDRTSLSIGALNFETNEVVVLGKMFKVALDKNYLELAEIMFDCGVQEISMENNADKGLMGEKFRELGFIVNSYHESMNKHTKIVSTIRPYWREEGAELLPAVQFCSETDEEYLKEIHGYKKGVKHDDAPDNLACLLLRGKFSSLAVRVS